MTLDSAVLTFIAIALLIALESGRTVARHYRSITKG